MLNKIRRTLWYILYKPQFQQLYISSYIKRPILISPKYISLGKNVHVRDNARIEAICKYNEINFIPHIDIKDNVSIEQNCHITCGNHIEIGKNTSIAANVTITDIEHPYTNITTPIERQDIQIGEVIIDCNSKIYNNTVILPNVHIGKHCVIGANSVVTKDIPDYSVAVGAPARIIKKYDPQRKKWIKTNI